MRKKKIIASVLVLVLLSGCSDNTNLVFIEAEVVNSAPENKTVTDLNSVDDKIIRNVTKEAVNDYESGGEGRATRRVENKKVANNRLSNIESRFIRYRGHIVEIVILEK